MYLYQLPEWPHFFWNEEKINKKLVDIHHLQWRLIGRMESIGFYIQTETFLQTLTKDVVKSCQIEGEILDPYLVRSSVARQLGMETAGLPVKNIEGVVRMMLDATQRYDEPLTKKRLLQWHKDLFPFERNGFSKIQVGNWRRKSVYVVSGILGKEIIHYEAPEAQKVKHEMKEFFKWFNKSELDFVLKAAIAHLWFVTIHPFDDGNGRIGRAIADLALARSEKSSKRFYSLSNQIQKERKSYYNILEKTQKDSMDITKWIDWFLDCLERAINDSILTLDKVLEKERFWERIKEASLNIRQRKILNLLLEGFEGKLTTSKWAKIAKCSQDTAYRDILDLIGKKILIKSSEGGRSSSYIIYQAD